MKTLNASVEAEIAKTAVTVADLLEIGLTGGGTLRYTTWETSLTVDGDVYYQRGFELPSIANGAGLNFNEISVAVDNIDGDISAAFVANDPRGQALALKRVFLTALGAVVGGADGRVTLFAGEIISATVTRTRADISARSHLCKLDRVIPQRDYGKSCPWVVGDADCGFDLDTTKVAAQTCDAGTTASVITDAARAEAANYWKDGVIEITSGAADGDKRRILSSAVGSVTMEHALTATPAAGDTYTLWQGCDQDWETCGSRFSNQTNFGGCVSLAEQVVKE